MKTTAAAGKSNTTSLGIPFLLILWRMERYNTWQDSSTVIWWPQLVFYISRVSVHNDSFLFTIQKPTAWSTWPVSWSLSLHLRCFQHENSNFKLLGINKLPNSHNVFHRVLPYTAHCNPNIYAHVGQQKRRHWFDFVLMTL